MVETREGNDEQESGWNIPLVFLLIGMLTSSAIPGIGIPLIGTALILLFLVGILKTLYGLVTVVEWLVIGLMKTALFLSARRKPTIR